MRKNHNRVNKILILTMVVAIAIGIGSFSYASGKDDVSGDHILYVPHSGTAAVMMAEPGNNSKSLRAKAYRIIETQEDRVIDTAGSEAPTWWHFEAVGNSRYLVSAAYGDEVAYLNISGQEVFLTDAPQEIVVRTDENGFLQLSDEEGRTVKLHGGEISYGFDAASGADAESWLGTAVTSEITVTYSCNPVQGTEGDVPEPVSIATTDKTYTVEEPAAYSYTAKAGRNGEEQVWDFSSWLGSDGQQYQPGDEINLSGFKGQGFVLAAEWTKGAAEKNAKMSTMKGAGNTETAEGEETEAGDFMVIGGEGTYQLDESTGDLRILSGTVEVRNKDGIEVTSQHIEVLGNATLVLNGVSIETPQGVLISPIRIAPGTEAELVLKEGSVNTVSGTEFKHDGYKESAVAGIEVGIEEVQGVAHNMSTLTISGKGTLIANGGDNAAGIGGSKTLSSQAAHGNIIINDGTIQAAGGSGGAGIGTASNMNSQLSNGSYKSSFSWGTITINGGNIHAVGQGSAAGIGGGNHVDSGNIIINGGEILAEGASGIGSGLGSSKNKGDAGDKGPGHYFATITINGGTITARATGEDNWGGAGIGGGGYCDADVTINGGLIHAYGGNCGSDHNSVHHGGAGIGGGYEGHANIRITGGEIYAYTGEHSSAAAIGSGGTPNSNPDRGNTGRSTEDNVTHLTKTTVVITGGTILADARQGRGGAGIGGGVSADIVSVDISGGDIQAFGAKSSEEKKLGGAGIGSGLYGSQVQEDGMTKQDSAKYHVLTETDVTITGGKVLSVGGWGASGIGSGALNKMADEIDLRTASEGGATIEAYADGTKFAIDTRDLKDSGRTESHTEGRSVDGYILQGTFVHRYTSKDGVNQGTEALGKIVVRNSNEKDVRILYGMEKYGLTDGEFGYRSFATDVDAPGNYTVFTDDEAIADGEGRYFNQCIDDDRTEEDVRTEQDIELRNVQYRVADGSLCDNFYLFPVKTIIVTKKVNAQEEVKDGLDLTLHYALWNDNDKAYVKDRADPSKIWTESIELKDGVPQGKAYFACVDEGTYGIWEMDDENNELGPGTIVKENASIVLTQIATRHGDTSDNDATIDENTWIDRVTVANTYEKRGLTVIKTFAGIEKEQIPEDFEIDLKVKEKDESTDKVRYILKLSDPAEDAANDASEDASEDASNDKPSVVGPAKVSSDGLTYTWTIKNGPPAKSEVTAEEQNADVVIPAANARTKSRTLSPATTIEPEIPLVTRGSDTIRIKNEYTQEPEPDTPGDGETGTLRILKKLSEGSDTVPIPETTAFVIQGPEDYNGGEPKTVTYAQFDPILGYVEEDVPPGTYTVTERAESAKVDGYILTATDYYVGENKTQNSGVMEISEEDTEDVIRIENTYQKDTARVTIRKSIPQYFDASASSNGTFVFRMTIYRSGTTPVTRYYAFDFTKAGTQSETIELDDASSLLKAEVTEVYGAGYDVRGTETRVIDLSDASLGAFTVSFDNKYDEEKVTQSSGIINKYTDRKYKSRSILNILGF